MKSAPNGYTPTVPSLHRDREIKRHERTKLRFYTERNSLEVVLIEDCLTTFSPALGAGEPQRLKPNSKQSTYRSGKPLRHPKTTATSTFSASCKAACVAGSDGMAEAMPFQNYLWTQLIRASLMRCRLYCSFAYSALAS